MHTESCICLFPLTIVSRSMEQVWHVYHGKVTLPAPFDTCMEQTVLACLHSTWKYARMHTHVQYNVHTYTYMYYRCTVISTYPCTYPVFDMVRCYHVHTQHGNTHACTHMYSTMCTHTRTCTIGVQ